MGIPYLNRYLQENCDKSIKKIHLKELKRKTIAIDASIYMYKYFGENKLIHHIDYMIHIFKSYHITPIFIFDGKPPLEKKQLLIKRYEEKKHAENEYNILSNIELDEDNYKLKNKLEQLKKKFIYLTKEKIQEVKDLLITNKIMFYDADGEADKLISRLAIEKKVWACLSEDMDLFVYGCPRILRYFSLVHHQAILYNMKGILQKLQMTQDEFRIVCILSGTDYSTYNEELNVEVENIPIYISMDLFQTMKHSMSMYNFVDNDSSFYEWIQENYSYKINIVLLKKIYHMFQI